MTTIVILFGVLIAALGGLGVARPAKLIGAITSVWQSPHALQAAVAFRFLFGIVLVIAAPESRFPAVFRFFGVMSLLSAFAALLIGDERVRLFVGWWAARPGWFVRVWAIVAFAFGAFLVYAGA